MAHGHMTIRCYDRPPFRTGPSLSRRQPFATASSPVASSGDVSPVFEYEYIEDVERLENYRPGGYHPISTGDILRGRYRIVHKLGHVGTASSSSSSREVDILSSISGAKPLSTGDFRGEALIPCVLDSFKVEGPNGAHPCYVTSPCMASLAGAKDGSYTRLFQEDTARALAAQLALALAFMHDQGFVHGDLHLGNVLLRLPQDFESLTDEELYARYGTPELEPIRRFDNRPLPPLFSELFATPDEITHEQVDVVGALPSQWWHKWEARQQWFNDAGEPAKGRVVWGLEDRFEDSVQGPRRREGMPSFGPEEMDAVLAMLRSMLSFRPETASNEIRPGVAPGAYMIELKDGAGHQLDTLIEAVEKLYEAATTRSKLEGLADAGHVYPITKIEMPPIAESNQAENGSDRNTLSRRESGNSASNSTYAPHVLTGVDRLHAEGINGTGVKVAVIDSGNKSVGTHNGDPIDCVSHGHGTSAVGILAAQPEGNRLGLVGVAPGASIGVYKVAGDCDKGDYTTGTLAEAIYKAFEDDAEIISISLGEEDGWNDDLAAIAVSRVVEGGVPCIVAAGNSGWGGAFHGHSPANAPGAISVANMVNDATPSFVPRHTYSISNRSEVEFEFRSGPFGKWTTYSSYRVYLPAVEDRHEACVDIPDDADLADTNTIVLIPADDDCPFPEQLAKVKAAKGQYVLTYGETWQGTDVDLPSGILPQDIGETWVQALRAGGSINVTMDPFHSLRLTPNQDAASVHSSSSWGPNWALNVKPQVGAPGHEVLTTSRGGGYVLRTGTSFAAPYVAGVAALIVQARGSHDPALIESLISSTAQPLGFYDGKQRFAKLAPPAQQGAGLIQAHAAVHSRARLTPPNISFNDSDASPSTLSREVTVVNEGDSEVEFSVSYTPAITVYITEKGSSQPAHFPEGMEAVEGEQGTATLRFSANAVTVAPGRSATVKVSASPPDGLDASRLPLWSGWINFNGSDGSALSIPYQGITGSLRKHHVLEDKGVRVATSYADKYHFWEESVWATRGQEFKMSTTSNGSEGPIIVVTPQFGVSLLDIDIMTGDPEATTFEVIGRPQGLPVRWLPMLEDYVYTWNGKLENGSMVPDGMYFLRIRALRLFGDPSNDRDYDKRRRSVKISWY
ncbi:Peptidase S8/S53, subtilisin/kexin/sedolisin [Purpureocillium lavendulum]|uniref:Peptidase S8/S53, subtilisin/kexin/sedolisin n=1 Tax=Purpureocillium lavendulum TaxID=1247861 RepID=A0AB34FT86_9HYPO|nr:Peptidase S8/S53, subtilisin/kexin/sedolisin [Purpureocillium lavendulum]